MKKFCILAAVAVLAFSLAGEASNAKTEPTTPGKIQPFQCDNTDSMNVAKFVNPGDGTVPLYLKTVVKGNTCGYEGAQITDTPQFNSILFEIAGTNNTQGFGPYIQVFYNGNNVSVLPMSTAHEIQNYGKMGILRQWTASDFNLPQNAQVSLIKIIANPSQAQDGYCQIRQIHINGPLQSAPTSRILSVINACP